MKIWWLVYFSLFIFSFLCAYLLTPFCRKLAFRWNILDHPGERKIHQEAKPYLGGMAIFLSFMLLIIIGVSSAVYYLPSSPYLPFEIQIYLSNVSKIFNKLLGLLVGGSLVFLLGLMDDIKMMKPLPKLIGQICIATFSVIMGIRLDLFIGNPYLSGALTVFWIVLITNSFNLLDNMDGLSAGVAAIATFIFIWFSYQAGHTYMMLILIVFMGSILGFLPYNFYPAKIFMGDAGAMFIGFELACLTVLNSYYYSGAPSFLPVLMPFCVLSVPLFDSISVIAIRLKNHKPIYQGDKNHFSHRLVDLGMTQKQAVLCIYFITLTTGISALFLSYLRLHEALLILLQLISIFAIIFLLEHTGRKN